MRQTFFKLVGLTVLAGSLFAGWMLMEYRQFADAALNVPEQGQVYAVTAGTSLKRVARDLEQQDVISSDRFLVLMARLNGSADSIKTGEYRLRPDMKPADLLRDMAAGNIVHYTLTLVEGWNFHQVLTAVKDHPSLTHTLTVTDPYEVMAALGYQDQHPEGRFFPETYSFPRGTTDVEFLRRAYQTMERILAEEWEGRSGALPLDSSYEALILASLIEKETSVPDERAAIAGVFTRRLEQNIRLQTDPSVIYGIGEIFDGNLRRRDLVNDNPYNTYRRHGLPPTPIAMPGRASIHAALHPLSGDDLFFVSRGDGSHEFSATLAEHNAAVDKYQRKLPATKDTTSATNNDKEGG